MAAKQQEKPPSVAATERFLRASSVLDSIPAATQKKDFHSDLVRGLLLSVDRVEPGRVVCSVAVKPAFANFYDTLHGGAVAAVAEAVAVACVRTVVGDKEFFLGESSTAYLSAAKGNAELEVNGRILRQGRSVVVTSVEFRLKTSRQLLYTSRATFYVMPVATL